ncbi:MAG: hypothetical protein ACHQ50_01995 [Fimbriimonadales bacterium]
MKLNLLPTYVSKEKATRGALLLSIVLFVVLILAAVGLYQKGLSDFSASTEGIANLEGKAKKAKDTADHADVVMQESETLLRNTNLAQAMQAHNKVYPDLYDKIRRVVPGFYRVNSMSAQSAGPNTTSVTLVGVLDTDQQYADLMLALLRIPEDLPDMKGLSVLSVSRAGFTNSSAMYVPAPSTIDQAGKPHKIGDGPIPDDPSNRLDYFMAQGKVTGYDNAGGFGAGQPGPRGAMPKSSLVTVTIVLSGIDLQSPDPKATLIGGGQTAAAPTSPGAGPAGAGGNLPGETPPAKGKATAGGGTTGGDSGSTGGRKRRGTVTDEGD